MLSESKLVKFMEVAKAISMLSKDSTKVGALVLDHMNMIVGAGVNGYPPGYDDNDQSNRYSKSIHAEINAIINSKSRVGEISKIFIYGLPPCGECLKFLVAYDVSHVYFCAQRANSSVEKWFENYEQHAKLHNIKVKEIDIERRI